MTHYISDWYSWWQHAPDYVWGLFLLCLIGTAVGVHFLLEWLYGQEKH